MFQARKNRFFKTQGIVLACLISLLLTASLLFAQGNTFRMMGRVLTEDGQPAPSGTVVRLETMRGSLVAQQPVDTDGGFEFDSLDKGDYRLTATAKGYQSAQKLIEQRFWVHQVFVRLTLTQSQFRIRRTKPGGVLDVNTVIPKSARKEYKKGKKAYDDGDLPGAEKYFESAVKQHPCYPEAQVQLSIVAGLRHKNSKTEAALRKVVKCAPDFLPAYFRLGFLLNAEKRFDESVKVVRSGLKHSAESWQLHHELAVAFAGQGKYAKSEEEYKKVLALNQQPPARFHAELANVYLHRDKYADAYREMEAYIKDDPKGPLAPAVRKSMREMKAAGVLSNASK